MPDTHSEEYRKARDERRELVQYAVEELIKETGQLPSGADVAREIGAQADNHTIRRDWDALAAQGKLPERPGRVLSRRIPGRSFGEHGGGSLLEAERLLRMTVEEIANATPEYREMARKFQVEHLDKVIALAEEAISAAMGTTVDDLIGQIERGK